MKRVKRLAVSAVVGMAALAVTGCGGMGGASEDHTYSVWLYNAQDASYYTDYAQNPTIRYLLSQTWGENDDKITLEFQVPPAGSQQNNYETMIATGDFPTLMQGSGGCGAQNAGVGDDPGSGETVHAELLQYDSDQ
ncbi:MAG: hypothetical protein HFH93_11345 [Lachnospiraceae bacterium]|nr:hypothetical protein [Lachnospiraceae bacterium]